MDPASEPRGENREPELDRGAPIPPIFRFLIAAIITWAANWLVATVSFSIFRDHLLLADISYRALGAALLIAIYSLLLAVLDHRDGDRLSAQGLPLGRRAAGQFLAGLALGILLIGLCVALAAAAGGYEVRVTFNARALRLSVEVLLLLLSGALLEEATFRGYPFQRLVEAVGPVWAVVALSALFGAAHLGNPNANGVMSWAFLNTIAIGVLLALAYLRTRALWLPFGLHFGWNFALGFVFGLPVSGMSTFSVIVHGSIRGPAWLTGGAYGLENSGAAAILLLSSLLVALTAAMGKGFRFAPEDKSGRKAAD